jgi:hypothetical protein
LISIICGRALPKRGLFIKTWNRCLAVFGG